MAMLDSIVERGLHRPDVTVHGSGFAPFALPVAPFLEIISCASFQLYDAMGSRAAWFQCRHRRSS